MKDRSEEERPATVSETTKQAGEVHAGWAWGEPQVWTERMLTTLEEGVKGGKWYSLIDKVYSQAVLKAAFMRVKANGGAPGVDRQTIEMFEQRLDNHLAKLLSQLQKGHVWVVDADLKSYFDTIPHQRLMDEVRAKISDGRVLETIESYLKQEVMETVKTWTPEQGAPQGAVVSPLLSNLYLDPLDKMMADKGVEMVRYADDFVILCRSKQEAQEALTVVKQWTDERGLTLHPEKPHIVDATQQGGFDFLGYHFERGYRWPRKKSLRKLKDEIRRKTRRANGHSLQAIILEVDKTLAGWFEYFKHSHRTTFGPLDRWIRMRLRSILRKRRGGKGRGRGRDHQRWTNAFFAEQGLFSLSAAHAQVCQSFKR